MRSAWILGPLALALGACGGLPEDATSGAARLERALHFEIYRVVHSDMVVGFAECPVVVLDFEERDHFVERTCEDAKANSVEIMARWREARDRECEALGGVGMVMPNPEKLAELGECVDDELGGFLEIRKFWQYRPPQRVYHLCAHLCDGGEDCERPDGGGFTLEELEALKSESVPARPDVPMGGDPDATPFPHLPESDQ